MKIKEVYEKYSIPPNLAEHMVNVARVAQFICSYWKGERIDKEEIIKSALVHDLGNIVRFDFEKHSEFLGPEASNVAIWRKKQQEVIQNYGTDDHVVTQKMLSELGFTDESIQVISTKSFSSSIDTLNSDDWNLKILLYSDMRISPAGVVSLNQRLEELVSRRKDLSSRPDINELCDAVRKIENQIQENLRIDISMLESSTQEMSEEALLEIAI